MDPDRLSAALTPKTKAIIPVHFAGQPCDMKNILGFARAHELKVIEDAAHALAAARRRIAEAYDAGFADLAEIRTPVCRPGTQHAWHLYVIQLELERLTLDRRQFIEALREKNIGTSVHFTPLHLHPFYRRNFGYRPADFANASSVYERIVSLPIYPRMSAADVDDVIAAVRSIVETHRR
jgi:dTDP-4-amino-4,6-dideoxygalactose transaminase